MARIQRPLLIGGHWHQHRGPCADGPFPGTPAPDMQRRRENSPPDCFELSLKVGDGGLGGISRRCSRAAVLTEKRICHMTKDAVVAFRAPEGFSADPLTDLLRQGARDLIAQAVEAELNAFLTAHADQTDGAGRRRLVRHGHLQERDIQTGIGAVPVKVPRLRVRSVAATDYKSFPGLGHRGSPRFVVEVRNSTINRHPRWPPRLQRQRGDKSPPRPRTLPHGA